jgi:phosphinothricin acetyltransferase
MRHDAATHKEAPMIRAALMSDVPAIREIYNEVLTNTTAIYDDVPVSLEDRQAWTKSRLDAGFPVLVAQDEGQVIGFSSFGTWRPRTGYRDTVEHSVHVRVDRRGQGVGRRLVEALFPLAQAQRRHVMIGHIDAEATASLALHEKLGFRRVGHFPEVAQKFGRWLDLIAVQRSVG